MRKTPLPLRRQDLQTQALDVRSGVGDSTEQVAGGQAELLQHLFDPDEKDVGELCALAQLSCRLKKLDGDEGGVEDELRGTPEEP